MVCGTAKRRERRGWRRLRTHSLLLIDAALPPCLPVVLLVIFFNFGMVLVGNFGFAFLL